MIAPNASCGTPAPASARSTNARREFDARPTGIPAARTRASSSSDPGRAGDRGERVVLAPQDQRRDAKHREPAAIRLELRELARAVEVEDGEPALLGLEAAVVLVEVLAAHPGPGLADRRIEDLAREAG